MSEALNASFASIFKAREPGSHSSAASSLEIADWRKAAGRQVHLQLTAGMNTLTRSFQTLGCMELLFGLLPMLKVWQITS